MRLPAPGWILSKHDRRRAEGRNRQNLPRGVAQPPRQVRDTCVLSSFSRGHQFVKGTVEAGETPAAAALRELYEEAGITAQAITTMLGSSNAIQSGEKWHFFVVQTDPLPDSWQHKCADDGGQLFGFFWHPVRQPLPDNFEHRFHKALHFIRAQLDLLPVP